MCKNSVKRGLDPDLLTEYCKRGESVGSCKDRQHLKVGQTMGKLKGSKKSGGRMEKDREWMLYLGSALRERGGGCFQVQTMTL